MSRSVIHVAGSQADKQLLALIQKFCAAVNVFAVVNVVCALERRWWYV